MTIAEMIHLKIKHHLTYRQLSNLVGVPPTTLCGQLRRAGHRERSRHSRNIQFWATANTAMALIRTGHTNLASLSQALGKSKSCTFHLVHRLIALGLVGHASGKPNTLHLTNPTAGSLIRLARRRPDGVLEKLPSPRAGGVRARQPARQHAQSLQTTGY